MPYAGKFDAVGKRVLLAWNASREANSRYDLCVAAVLKAAKQVVVSAVKPDCAVHGDAPGTDIGLYLARHAVKVEPRSRARSWTRATPSSREPRTS